MKYLIILVAIVVVYLSFYYLRIIYYTNYANTPQISPQDQTLGNGPRLKYIATVDSTALGQGLPPSRIPIPFASLNLSLNQIQ